MTKATGFELIYQKLLSDKTKHWGEQVILVIAIASFLIHLAIIYLVDFGIIPIAVTSDLLKNPIAAIYTPFSFILVYEVYLLIHYLPKSITTYISKQYEIITLIIIRRLFKDLSSLTLTSDWFTIKYDLQFTYDLLASVLLFFLIYLFYKQSKKRYRVIDNTANDREGIARFIKIKKYLATALVPVLIVVAVYSFINWSMSTINPQANTKVSFSNINNIFFEQFFTILIIADVVLLLFSFFHTDEFHKVIRNSGFIISTILIRLSFSVSGLLNTLLIVSATIFGLLILIIHNKFEKEKAAEMVDSSAHKAS
jgi:small-conductance mechanosensitive channel